MNDIAYPFQIGSNGRVKTADRDDHIRQMIEQLLFTGPGERVNRPDFGTGVMQLVFAPNSPELAATTQSLVQGALQRWLGDVITPQAVQVTSEDATLTIAVQYVVLRTQEQQVAQFAYAL